MAAEGLYSNLTENVASVAFSVSEDTPIIVTYNSEGVQETSCQVIYMYGPTVTLAFKFRCLNSGGTELATATAGLTTNGFDGVDRYYHICGIRAVTQKMVAPAGTATVTMTLVVTSTHYYGTHLTTIYRNYPPRSITVLGTKR